MVCMICEIFRLPKSKAQRTLLLDRDQTLIADSGYFHDVNQIKYLDNQFDFISQLNDAGVAVILVSNQSGIARGIFPIQASIDVNREITKFFEKMNGSICASLFCPHLPNSGCECRKPEVQMLEFAFKLTGSPVASSLFIGDQESDANAAKNFGMPFAKSDSSGIRSIVQDWI